MWGWGGVADDGELFGECVAERSSSDIARAPGVVVVVDGVDVVVNQDSTSSFGNQEEPQGGRQTWQTAAERATSAHPYEPSRVSRFLHCHQTTRHQPWKQSSQVPPDQGLRQD